MAESAINITGTDFVTLPTRDFETAAAFYRDVLGQGVEFVADTIDSGVCLQAIFKDPDGNVLDLHHRYAPQE